jgi:hypothetical protein
MPGLLKQPRQAGGAPVDQQQAIEQAIQMTEQQMAQGRPQGQQMPQGQPESQPQGPEQAQGEEGGDPMLDAAIDFVRRALYETGSADGVNESLSKTRQPVEDMATLAYELTSMADEKTEGQIPDEMLMTLAVAVLSEVAEIAEASGVKLQPSDIASALKIMTLRFVGEMGHDTRSLQQAFNQVSPEQINQLAAEDTNV